MESKKKVGFGVMVATAMVLVSTLFLLPTVFAVRHKSFEEVPAAVEPDSNDKYGAPSVPSVTAEPDSTDDQYHDNVIVKEVESSRNITTNQSIWPGYKDGCPGSRCEDIITPCKLGCICVPITPFYPLGFCSGICCAIPPPPDD